MMSMSMKMNFLTESQKEILEELRKTSLNAQELYEVLGYHVGHDMHRLKKYGFIIRESSIKGGRWRAIA